MPKPRGYRVDLVSFETGLYSEYTGRRSPVTLEMAASLAEHLRRSQTGGRIVRVPDEVTVASWAGKEQNSGLFRASQQRVQRLREQLITIK